MDMPLGRDGLKDGQRGGFVPYGSFEPPERRLQPGLAAPHPIQRRYLAEELVRLRRAGDQSRFAASQRQGHIDPNPHQIDAVIFALKRIPEGGCILADEVGLGKTIEAGLVIAQLLAEGSARRILLIVPKPLLGQWQDELFRLFEIQALEGGHHPGPGVFLMGRENAGSERGAAILENSEPFDLCVIDEAHEVFANIYRRFDRDGNYREDSPDAQTAGRIRGFLRQAPVLLLTATPIQNNLTELWGLVQYVEPTGTLLGTLPTFRNVFCDGDDRTLVKGQDHELRRRLGTVVQRTLRRQAQDFLERPFVARRAQIFEYTMTPPEKALYDDVTDYLLDPHLIAFRGNQRQLLLIGFHRLMASSIKALSSSLRKVAKRLEAMRDGRPLEKNVEFFDDLDDEDVTAPPDEDDPAPKPGAIEAELFRVQNFIERAESLPRDSKAEKLLEVMQVISERAPDRRRAVIFTESLVTQKYLEELLIARGGFDPGEITLFRGVNDSPRAAEALRNWQKLGLRQPSRDVAVRMALVHEFKTVSRIFISTEAGAKGLNLQFCDTVINYDLPWNPQRIEQRIGRCHRYGQEHDVTVINFLASDNEAQKLTFDILSRKLDLFGQVLDASDVVLHEPSTDAPETLAGALGSDFESRLRRIYDRARTVQEIAAELRRLREDMDEQRSRFEEVWARTAGLIESRFDQRVRQVFTKLRSELPEELARLDEEMDRIVNGYLQATGTTAPEAAGQLHLGHPLVRAAVEEARAATHKRFCVAWKLAGKAGKRGRLAVDRVRYEGFERVDRLITAAVLDGEDDPLDTGTARALLEQTPRDLPGIEPPFDLEDALADAMEQEIFIDQAEVATEEQQSFNQHMEQIERYVEDQILVLRRRLSLAAAELQSAREKRDAALGSDAREQAEQRIRRVEQQIEAMEAEVARLDNREDPAFEKWRERAHQRRFRPPDIVRILDVEFILE
jgi:superfamily II DNA or RNA helicase